MSHWPLKNHGTPSTNTSGAKLTAYLSHTYTRRFLSGKSRTLLSQTTGQKFNKYDCVHKLLPTHSTQRREISVESLEAFAAGNKDALREMVYEYIRSRGLQGAIADEASEALGLVNNQ